MDIFLENWAEIILAAIALADVIVSLTPSEADDRFVGYLRTIVNALAGKGNRKKRKE